MDTEGTFGTLFVGFVLSTILYGLTSFQAYVYFSRYSKDPVPLRLLSGFLWTIDSASTGLLAHTMYVYLVRDFGLAVEVVNATTTFCISNILTAIAIVHVQVFYIWRSWTASNKSQSVYVAALTSALTLSFGLASAIQLFRNRDIADFARSTTWALTLAYAACGTTCALYLCFALLRFLPSRKELHGPSRLESLVAYALNRPVIIAAFQVAYLISTIIEPSKLYQLPFLLVLGKVYINVLLATLNYRAVRDDRGINEEESQASTSTTRSEKMSDFRSAVRPRQSSGLSSADGDAPKRHPSDMIELDIVHAKRSWETSDGDPMSSNDEVGATSKGGATVRRVV